MSWIPREQAIKTLEDKIRADRLRYADLGKQIPELKKGPKLDSLVGGMKYLMDVIKQNEKELQELRAMGE